MDKELKILKALSNDIRYSIIKLLLNNEYCITDIGKMFDRDFSVVYRHIKHLHSVGLIDIKREGRSQVICLKNPEKIKKLLEILKDL